MGFSKLGLPSMGPKSWFFLTGDLQAGSCIELVPPNMGSRGWFLPYMGSKSLFFLNKRL